MSFSSDVKTELCRVEAKKICCLRAECYGAWLFSRCFGLKEAAFVTEFPMVARKMAELAAVACSVTAEITFAVSRRKKQAYRLLVPEEASRRVLLRAFGHTGQETTLRINRANLEETCCVSAFLRGAFLACGMVTDPASEYHLEFITQFQHLTKDLSALLREQETPLLQPLAGSRKGSLFVYLKDSSQIEGLLTYIGAGAAAMALMQVKMYKELKNDINRRSNFETANMDKTYSASARQIAAIARICDAGRLADLPPEQQLLAQLRLENPEMTLRELSQATKIPRSGINYRMNRIMQFAETLPSLLAQAGASAQPEPLEKKGSNEEDF